jgi:hypothetical protein
MNEDEKRWKSVLPLVPPQEGGCWFCYNNAAPILFSTEFDSYVHDRCLRAELEMDPNNREAIIMARELYDFSS